MDSITLKTLDGLEAEAVVGALVRVAEDGYAYLGRLMSVNAPNRYGLSCQVHLSCFESSSSYCASALTLISHAPQQAPKDAEVTLAQRRTRLLRNLSRAIGQCPSSQTAGVISCLYARIDECYRQGEHAWFWQSVAESLDDPRLISYAGSIEHFDNDARRRRCSMKKFLSGPAKQHGLELTAEEIEAVSNQTGQSFPTTNDYSFQIVAGEEVTAGYHAPENVPWHSCMYCKPYVNWYAENPDAVALVKIMQGQNYVGRALLWTAQSGDRIVDRVYPSDNGPHTDALHRMAEQNGWDYKTRQGCYDGYLKSDKNHAVKMKPSSSGDYPYCDTFKYTDYDPDSEEVIYLNTRGGNYCFNGTDGGYEGRRGSCNCEQCGCRLNEEHAIYSERGEAYYCGSCYNETFVQLYYRLPNGDHVEREEWRADCSECEHCAEHRRPQDVEDVDGQTWCLMCIDAHAFACEDCDELLPNDRCSDSKNANVCYDCGENRRTAAAEQEAEAVEDRKQDTVLSNFGARFKANGAVTNAPRDIPIKVLVPEPDDYSRASWAEILCGFRQWQIPTDDYRQQADAVLIACRERNS